MSSYWGGRQAAVSYTFDDGLQDQYTLAWPQLRKRGLKVSLLSVAQTRMYYPVSDRLEVTSLDGTWQFKLDNAPEWRTIQVPGNWETQGVKTPDYVAVRYIF